MKNFKENPEILMDVLNAPKNKQMVKDLICYILKVDFNKIELSENIEKFSNYYISDKNFYVIELKGNSEGAFLDALEEGYLSVIPGVASVDATIYKNEYTTEPIYFIQTPQGFKKDVLLKAFDEDVSLFRDEGSIVMKKCGITPHVVNGSYSNIKITNKEDLELLDKE